MQEHLEINYLQSIPENETEPLLESARVPDPLPTTPQAKDDRTKPVILKAENAECLVLGQTEMATALGKCAEAFEKSNSLKEVSLQLKKRKLEIIERELEIKKQKANAIDGILQILKDKFC